MLVQWRYKVCCDFGKQDGSIINGRKLESIKHSKPYPDRFFLYRVSKRKYDYVDYTGVYKGKQVNPSGLTSMLEFLGYIRFVSKEKCNGRIFK